MKLLDKILKPKTIIKVPVMGVANAGERERMRKIIESDPIGYIKGYKYRCLKGSVDVDELEEYNYNIREFYKDKCKELTIKDIDDLMRISNEFGCNMEVVKLKVDKYIERKV